MNFDSWPEGLVASLYPIKHLLSHPEVTDIMANAHDEIWVSTTTRSGHRRVRKAGWRDKQSFKDACTRISDVIGRPLGPHNLTLDARLPGGERVNIVFPPACERIALTIRKFSAVPMSLETLVEKESISPALSKILDALVQADQSIIVAGGTGAGKTSLVNALAQRIPRYQRVITIEDARELQIVQPNWVALETVTACGEVTAELGIGALLKNSLRQFPSRIIIGEVRGEEAFHLLDAFSNGHKGGLGTVHSNNAVDALHRLQLLAQLFGGANLTAAAVAKTVMRAVDVVIYQKYFPRENRRRISEIVEVEKPDGHVGDAHDYRVRRLVQWDGSANRWVSPEEPSPALREALAPYLPTWPIE